MQLREEIGFDDTMTWHKLKVPLRVGSIFLKPENRSVPKFMNIKSYMSIEVLGLISNDVVNYISDMNIRLIYCEYKWFGNVTGLPILC